MERSGSNGKQFCCSTLKLELAGRARGGQEDRRRKEEEQLSSLSAGQFSVRADKIFPNWWRKEGEQSSDSSLGSLPTGSTSRKARG